MNEEWRAITLGDVIKRVKRPVAVLDGVEYPAVSVLKDGQGLGAKEPFQGGVTNYSNLFQVRTGDVVVRTITAFESPVAVAEPQHDATHVSQVFLTYEVSERVLPAYLALYFQTPAFWEEMRDRAQGTVLRRKTISDSAFRTIPVSLPPLAVQRRIVDLMEHLDNQVDRLQAEAESTAELLSAYLGSAFSGSRGTPRVSLGEIAEVRLGRMLSKERSTGEDQAPYIRNANVQWSGLDLSDLKQMSFPSGTRVTYALKAGDILVCEGGDPGRAVLLERDLPGVFYQKAVHRVRGSDVDCWFLYGAIRAAYNSGTIADLCTNTTIAHLTAEKFRTLAIDLPSPRRQREIGQVLSDLMALQKAHIEEQVAFGKARESLLSVLLHGRVAIPESYDELLGLAS